MSYTSITEDFAKLVGLAYKKEEKRPRVFSFGGYDHDYKDEFSTGLWVRYENATTVLVGIHGADDARLIQIAGGQFIDPEKVEKEMNEFCEVFKELLKITDKRVYISSHSLGCWITAGCEMLNHNNRITGYMFSPYVPDKTSVKSKFIAETYKYKKVFYNNDWFANNLLKMDNLNNMLILMPKNNNLSFLNGHALKLFVDVNLALINDDILKYYKPIIKDEEKDENLGETSIKIISYNVKMLNPLIFQLRSNDRAKWISDIIEQRYNDVDVIIFCELFDGDAKKVFNENLSRLGFSYTETVGSGSKITTQNISQTFSGKTPKLDNGGVRIYSKLEIEKEDYIIYKDSSKEDALANKGAIRIRVRKNGIPIYVIGTHLQSGRKEGMIQDKYSQFKQLNDELISENEEIVIIGGDMNVDKFSQKDILNKMLTDNNIKEFNYNINTPFSVDTDFSGEPSSKRLDYFFHKPSERYSISGTIDTLQDFRLNYQKPKNERISEVGVAQNVVSTVADEYMKYTVAGQIYEEAGDTVEKGIKKVSNIFTGKKKKKKHKSKRSSSDINGMIGDATYQYVEDITGLDKDKEMVNVTDLSDHKPIYIDVKISELSLNQTMLTMPSVYSTERRF